MNKNYQKDFTIKALNLFLENTFELAFGENAIDKYTMKEVVDKLKEYAEGFHEMTEILLTEFNSIEDFEKAKKELLDKYL